MRETQEGCPSPLKSVVFETFSKFQKLYEQPRALCHKIMSNFMPPTVYDFTNTKIVYHEGCKS